MEGPAPTPADREAKMTFAGSAETEPTYGYGLPAKEVERLRKIVKEECDLDLSMDEAWAEAIELVSFGRLLVEAELAPHARV
jgi:hypothetical protein